MKERFKLGAEASVVSCYEAGQDGFWPHRQLAERGIDNRVVDSASTEVNRRHRRAKTDRLDVRKLLEMLVRAERRRTRGVAGCAGLDPTPYDSGESRREQG